MAIVTIGTQTWDDQNLDVDAFSDGTPIAHASSSQQWVDYCVAGTPAWRYYDDDSGNAPTHGRLYNWYVVSASITSKNLVQNPQFKVPTSAEFNTLLNHLGGSSVAGFPMKNSENWSTLTRISGNGSNSSGWKGNPGGYSNASGEFFDLSWSGNWWCRTSSSATTTPAYRLFWQNRSAIAIDTPMVMGLSIRLIVSGSWTGSNGFRPSGNFIG